MGIIFLFVLIVAGATGALSGAVIALGIGFAAPGTLSLHNTLLGLVGGGILGLLAGLIVVVRALRDYWKPRGRRDEDRPSHD